MFHDLHSARCPPKASGRISRRSNLQVNHLAGKQAGFALIVVLAGLAVLTTMFSLTSKTVIGRGLDQRGNVVLVQRQAETVAKLDRILALGPDTARSMSGYQLQDVGGYIDLNTADKDLIQKILRDLDLPASAMTTYQAWRRSTNRFGRLEDFLRVVGAPPSRLPRLQRLATVHSYRQGIATDIAPKEVLGLVSGLGNAPLPLMRNRVSKKHTTSPTVDVFRVWDKTGATPRALGVVYLPNDAHLRRIIWLN